MRDALHRVRFRLDHRWVQARLSEYLDADLTAARRRRLEHHVAECEACRRALASLRALLAALHRVPASADEAQAAQIAAAVRLRLGAPQDPR